ncbi:MAG: LacI family DNA-binding transcriptional regulator [Oscillospiraceae bacterium]
MVSLKDIALKCGVSVATVSKALNGHTDISVATRDRLLKAAKEMGYFPNSQARALKTNRTFNIGLMFVEEPGKGFAQEFFAKIISNFKTACEKAGYDITFINKGFGKQKMSSYEHCKYRNVDGILLTSGDFTDPDVYEIINGDIPSVTIDHIFDNSTAIMSSNEIGVEKLVDFVYKKGHRKIAYISGSKAAVTERRLLGFYKACKVRGIEINPDWMLQGDYHNPVLTYDLTKNLISQKDKPTCIFMSDDYSAIGGFNALRDMGFSVPDDISLVGFDGISYSQLMRPKLTTYLQDTETIGKTAAQRLISLIEEPEKTFSEVITIDGWLLEGESVRDLNE